MARKKKTKVEKKEPDILEVDGFKLGDSIWCEYHNGVIYYGDIIGFFVDEKEGNCVNIMTLEAGYRTALLEKCSYERIKKNRSKKKLLR